MYVRCNPNKKNIKYLSYVKGFRDKNGISRQVTVSKIGDWEDLIKKFDDPIKHFNELAKNKDDEFSIIIEQNQKISNENTRFNLGYCILKKIYNELELKQLLNTYQKKTNIQYNLNDILQLLIYSRILYPASKKETFDNKNRFFDDFDFSLNDLYRSLDHFSSLKSDIEKTIWDNTKESYKRDTSTVYYDCTNYYFEISYNDEDLIDEQGNILEKAYRKKGPEKNKRPDSIISLGLLMDNNCIPLSYTLFPGNESEKTTLRPILKNSKNNFNLDRLITVADRGLNTSDNTVFIAGKNDDTTNKDGYIFGQSILSADKEFKDYVLNPDDYVIDKELDKNGSAISFKHKSRIFAKTIQINRDGKRTNKSIIYQRQMVYYSDKYAQKQKKQRDLVIEKAKDLINNPGKYTRATSFGATTFINNIKFEKESGLVSDDCVLSINEDKINELEKFDGYYSIVSSELNMSDKELRDKYKGLWEIEETFKISKSQIQSRPVYVWTKDHIESHFLTCFISLVIIRLLEKSLDDQYSYEKIIDSLKKYECSHLKGNYYLFDFRNEIIEQTEKIFNFDLSNKYQTISNIRKILNNI